MKTIRASTARSNLYKLLDETAELHEPVRITGKRKNAVLISEEDWRAVQETLYLLSVPGVRASICRGMKTPISKLSTPPGW
jgi:antitoxin YefM